MKVQKLKSKYETLVGQNAGDDKGQAFHIIKAAQRREELQREGDELDVKIRQAEREIRALERTLAALTNRNINYRNSFQRADVSTSQAKMLRRLEEQVKTAKDTLFKKKKELQRMQSDFEDDERKLRQTRMKLDQLSTHLNHLQDAHAQVREELSEQRGHLEDSNSSKAKAQRRLRVARGLPEDTVSAEENMFKAIGYKETSANVLFTLGKLGQEFNELYEPLYEALHEQGIDIPSRPGSRISSRG